MINSYKKFISKEELNDLPLFEYEGKIELIENSERMPEIFKILSSAKVLGFDTETRPSFSKGESYPVALLQLATPDCAYIFRLSKMALPRELISLFSNPDIIKAGVAIRDDLKALQKLVPFNPQGFVDLAKEVEKVEFTSLGLRALTGIFLGLRLSKAAKVTNWERATLTEAQIKYAASDAVVGLKIYEKLSEMRIPA